MHHLPFVLVLLLATLVASLTDITSADAARRKRVRDVVVRENVAPPFPAYVVPANRPRWAPRDQCFTDEGHGRYLPCGTGDSGGGMQ
jgi:hypothetical protein